MDSSTGNFCVKPLPPPQWWHRGDSSSMWLRLPHRRHSKMMDISGLKSVGKIQFLYDTPIPASSTLCSVGNIVECEAPPES